MPKEQLDSHLKWIEYFHHVYILIIITANGKRDTDSPENDWTLILAS